MIDQAEALRTLVRDRVASSARDGRAPNVFTVAVTSGKGGVGKTTIAVNLALLLARKGRAVRMVDADFGLSNAEVLMGVTPRYNLEDVLRGRIEVRDAWLDAPGGVKLLSSGSGLVDMANLDEVAGVHVLDCVLRSASDGDVIVIDTAPGIDESVLSLLELADHVMMVTTPEPTSIADTYAALKVLLARRPDASITLVANSCASPVQAAAIAEQLRSICARFLGGGFEDFDYLPADGAVGRAIRARRPLATCSSQSPACTWLRKLTIKLEGRIRSCRVEHGCHG